MFATRRRLDELTRELHQLQLIVARLRRDLNSVKSELLKLDDWGDNFVKTRQISYREAGVSASRAVEAVPSNPSQATGSANFGGQVGVYS